MEPVRWHYHLRHTPPSPSLRSLTPIVMGRRESVGLRRISNLLPPDEVGMGTADGGGGVFRQRPANSEIVYFALIAANNAGTCVAASPLSWTKAMRPSLPMT